MISTYDICHDICFTMALSGVSIDFSEPNELVDSVCPASQLSFMNVHAPPHHGTSKSFSQRFRCSSPQQPRTFSPVTRALSQRCRMLQRIKHAEPYGDMVINYVKLAKYINILYTSLYINISFYITIHLCTLQRTCCSNLEVKMWFRNVGSGWQRHLYTDRRICSVQQTQSTFQGLGRGHWLLIPSLCLKRLDLGTFQAISRLGSE